MSSVGWKLVVQDEVFTLLDVLSQFWQGSDQKLLLVVG